MPRSIQNPRRRPRVPLRMPVEIVHHGETWRAETGDVGPGGCLVSSPRPLLEGAQLRLVLRCATLDEALDVAGSVAWAREALGGVAFAPRLGLGPRPDAWFQRILDAHPALASGLRRVPDAVELDAPLYLLPVPRKLRDLAPDELVLLGRASNGITVGALLSALPAGGERAARSLFALFEKDVLTLSMGKAGEAWKWRAAIAAANGPTGGGQPAHPVAPAIFAPAARPVAIPATFAAAPRRSPSPAVPNRILLRGVGAARRPPEAQARLDAARGLAAAARIDQAVALLRQALALAPRDTEISALLGELAFKDRRV